MAARDPAAPLPGLPPWPPPLAAPPAQVRTPHAIALPSYPLHLACISRICQVSTPHEIARDVLEKHLPTARSDGTESMQARGRGRGRGSGMPTISQALELKAGLVAQLDISSYLAYISPISSLYLRRSSSRRASSRSSISPLISPTSPPYLPYISGARAQGGPRRAARADQDARSARR